MESKNARFLRQGMVESCRKMTPAQRVRAFIDHSRMMKKIFEAGERRRKSIAQSKPDHG